MKKTLFRLAPLFIITFSFLFSLNGNAQSMYKDLYPNGKIRSIGKFNVVGKEDSIWKALVNGYKEKKDGLTIEEIFGIVRKACA